MPSPVSVLNIWTDICAYAHTLLLSILTTPLSARGNDDSLAPSLG